MNELLQELLEEFRDKITTLDGSVPRTANFPNIANKILAAIGMRRAS